MTPYTAYQRSATIASTHIDLLLALYNGAIDRITSARSALQQGDPAAAATQSAKAQLIVGELAAGVRPEIDASIGTDFLRLYEFVVGQLGRGDESSFDAALRVLNTLREGFQAIRSKPSSWSGPGRSPASMRFSRNPPWHNRDDFSIGFRLEV